MSSHPAERARVTIPGLVKMKEEGRRIVMSTAYDAATANIADPVVDMILVGDSVANVSLGFDSTLPVTVDMMNHHLEAVMRTAPKALVVTDLPFLSYNLGVEDTIRNAGGYLRRGSTAVKLEGGASRAATIRALVDCAIPVMGHLGLTPQSVNVMGGYKVQGRSSADAVKMLEDAHRLQEAGCFSLILEGTPTELAARITETLDIPTIGIGAGPHCSGQVLVLHDVLGLHTGHKAKFVRTYVDGYAVLQDALGRWADDVRAGAVPDASESYALPEASRSDVESWRPPVRGGDAV